MGSTRSTGARRAPSPSADASTTHTCAKSTRVTWRSGILLRIPFERRYSMNRPWTMRCLRHALMGTLLALAATAPALAATYYVVKDLGTLPGDTDAIATGINGKGDVVGWSNGPNGYRGF